jgi:enoyl-CoA hydratase/carnithine racemase
VLALCCDYRVMAQGEYAIGLNEVVVGIPLPGPVFELLARAVGRRHAERCAVSGRMLPPAEALAIGLVDELAPPEEVVARAVGRCHELLRLPAQAMLETRALARADLVAALAAEDESMVAHLVARLQARETRQALESVAARLIDPSRPRTATTEESSR